MYTRHLVRRVLSRLARDLFFRSMNNEAAYDILRRTAEVLHAQGAQWWLTDGTLLGFVRDDGFLGHDTDVDLGIMISDYSPDLEAALERAGLQIYDRYGTPDNGLQITVRSRWLYLPGTSLDLFFFYDDETSDTRWHAAYFRGTQFRYRYPRFDLGTLTHRGETYAIPSPPEDFLVAKYGEGWRTPDPSWHNMLSPRCLDLSHLPPEQQESIRSRRGTL